MDLIRDEYREMREHEGLKFIDSERCYLAGTLEDVSAFLRSENMTVEYPFRASRQVFGKTMLDSDEPDSFLVKKSIAAFFSSRAVKCYEEVFITRIIRNILSENLGPDSGTVDFDDRIAQRIPTQVILAVFGIDTVYDRYIYGHLDVLVQYIDNPANSLETAAASKKELMNFLRKCINGETGTDPMGLISKMDRSVYKDEEDLLSTLLMVMTAGMATTIAAFNSLILSMYANQSVIEGLVTDEPAVKRFVEKLLFEMPPLHATIRFVKIPFAYKGVNLKRNGMVKVFLASANMEQACPHLQQMQAENQKISSYTFGKGKHACLGANLAISEMVIFLREFQPYMTHFSTAPVSCDYDFTGMAIKSIKNIKLSRIL